MEIVNSYYSQQYTYDLQYGNVEFNVNVDFYLR